MAENVSPSPATPAADEVGQVVAFFAVPSVAIVKVTQGTLKLNDKIWIRGHTTDLTETISSMQIDHQPVAQAQQGQEVGIKISGKARQHDRVYKIA